MLMSRLFHEEISRMKDMLNMDKMMINYNNRIVRVIIENRIKKSKGKMSKGKISKMKNGERKKCRKC